LIHLLGDPHRLTRVVGARDRALVIHMSDQHSQKGPSWPVWRSTLGCVFAFLIESEPL
jgi:hypothetical protein